MTQDSNQSSAGEKAGSPLIELIKLRKEYGAAVTALENVSFTVDRGEWIAVDGAVGFRQDDVAEYDRGSRLPDCRPGYH